TERGIASELSLFVATDAPIKFSVLRVRNTSGRPRRLSATGYVEWVLGDVREKTAMHVVTEIEPTSGAVCARNRYNTEFSGRVAFFDVSGAARTVTGDRREFIGRNGSLERPAAMQRAQLSNRLGAGFDPCAALHVPFDLPDGETRELVFRLGVAGGEGLGKDTDVRALLERFRGAGAAGRAREQVAGYWQHTLGAVQVSTPDAALNVLANGWLVYQTLACRMWARSGFYQSGGAFGFRDQLQDAMALVHADPQVLRKQLLLCASRQYREGDVQHWWHPPSGRGVRTRCSDDLLWLPLAIARYVTTTADTGVLQETIPFLEGRAVEPREDSYYDLPRHAEERASLYEHGMRAITKSLRFGPHWLPLMGTGDWNDGMNLVGEGGVGESVWLGFFMYDVLMRYGDVARRYGDSSFADRCSREAERLQRHIEEQGWDGEWYRRAYFDDGTPLGSRSNPECAIDSISQSWSVLSGAARIERSRQAMDAVDEHLVRRQDGLIKLLSPPFDTSDLNPGYIKGYVPGVRENGGQYTHAAIWAAMAFAMLGDTRRAWELFAIVNPVNHARDADGVAKYKVEPYVVAADVYALAPHVGRGGWTWYTGSAGWMYRLIVESLLGLKREGDRLSFVPCLPEDWDTARIDYRFWDTRYEISIVQSGREGAAVALTVDGHEEPDCTVALVNDGLTHYVTLSLSAPARVSERSSRRA
ncbi:MAG: GH36-type glycosyl hydrolase domain-containing protein, partial [Burkholderiales bacterium]